MGRRKGGRGRGRRREGKGERRRGRGEGGGKGRREREREREKPTVVLSNCFEDRKGDLHLDVSILSSPELLSWGRILGNLGN